jgi:ceramide glucosyltransferase
MHHSLRAVTQTASPVPPACLPPVSILKPLRGTDPLLAENLGSLFRQAYPAFEVILGTEEEDDPALPIARRVAAEHPSVRSVVVPGGAAPSPNPKVSNLAHLARHAQHSLLLISDSNLNARPDHLRDLVAHRTRAGGGLVWALFRGVGGFGLGGLLEGLQLNVYMAGGACVLQHVFRLPSAVGKAMLVDRSDLERIGGFAALSPFLAEDHVFAEELAARGRPIVLCGHPVDNVLGPRTIRDFLSRQLRWSKIRRRISLPGHFSELLLNPVLLAVTGAAALGTPAALAGAAATLVLVSLGDARAERRLGVRRPLLLYPFLELLLSLLRGAVWGGALVRRTLVWRGHRIRIGRRTRIETVPPRPVRASMGAARGARAA